VSGALAHSGLDGKRLTLELTESAIIHDPDRVAKALSALKRFDVSVAMDDFGSGFTSLSMLQ
jgi:EAL domain-containing protein (putative c-di-GMP-specific phosphodiesterase class I)